MTTPDATPFSVHNGDATANLLLICDHASNALPQGYGTLGLPEQSLQRHIAYDIGAAEVARGLAERLGCVAVLGGFSRLLIDPNRGLDDPTLVMKLSDGEIIPANLHVDADDDHEELQRRIDSWYLPYHEEISRRTGSLQGDLPALIAVHSFTPSWKGEDRPWDIGILWGEDDRLAQAMVASLENLNEVTVGHNEPYHGGLEGESVERHGLQNGFLHACLEIRQDQLGTAEERNLWIARLEKVIPEALSLARKSRR